MNYLLEDMNGKGVSEGSESTWSLPVVLVWKKEVALASDHTTDGRMTSLKDCIPHRLDLAAEPYESAGVDSKMGSASARVQLHI
jgi:hypothetical protein